VIFHVDHLSLRIMDSRAKVSGGFLVENGVAGVEVGGVGDPGKVGNEKECCDFRVLAELQDGQENYYPKEDDDEESCFDLMSSEKDRGPGKVQDELQSE